MSYDTKALNILFDFFWGQEGWKRNKKMSDEDFNYAKDCGVMFDKKKLNHTQMNDWVKQSFEKVTKKRVTDAFLASLTTRSLELRAALSSYAVARVYPEHNFHQLERIPRCSICGKFSEKETGYDLNVLNFERLKWGGVRHTDPMYVAFNLEQFNQLTPSVPTEKDISIFKNILRIVQSMGDSASANDLEKALVEVFPSNKDERRALIDSLGIIGMLETPDHEGYFKQFIPYSQRPVPNVNKIDWNYPVSWWKGKDGLNKKVFEFYFGEK
jgi:hypothetical protein